MARRHERREHKKKRFAAYFSVSIIAIMVLSAIGLFWQGADPSVHQEYAGYSFDITNNGWMTKINGERRYFIAPPLDTLSLDLPENLVNILSKGPAVVFTSSFNDTYRGELAQAQVSIIQEEANDNVYAYQGFTDYQVGNILQLTCDNATSSVPVVVLGAGLSTGVTQSGNCYNVTFSSNYDIALFRDRVLYELLGIHVVG